VLRTNKLLLVYLAYVIPKLGTCREWQRTALAFPSDETGWWEAYIPARVSAVGDPLVLVLQDVWMVSLEFASPGEVDIVLRITLVMSSTSIRGLRKSFWTSYPQLWADSSAILVLSTNLHNTNLRHSHPRGARRQRLSDGFRSTGSLFCDGRRKLCHRRRWCIPATSRRQIDRPSQQPQFFLR